MTEITSARKQATSEQLTIEQPAAEIKRAQASVATRQASKQLHRAAGY